MSVVELTGPEAAIRIPELRTIPLTGRIAEIVDHPAYQRLRTVRQLGPIHLVYPGAVHTRFEHSLGVYEMAGRYLKALLRTPSVTESLTAADIECCLLAGLLHDIGHYPFAHSLEAVHLEGRDTPRHEDLSGAIIRGEVPSLQGERSIASIIDARFEVSAEDVISMIQGKPRDHARSERRLVASIISSGVDADKADYLERDSIHMGVTYGRNYDRARFLDSLCPNLAEDHIAVSDKGKVAAEIFIFCRYTMFSEAYWHHTVRSVAAMVERALLDYQMREEPDPTDLRNELLARPDDQFLAWLVAHAPEASATHRILSSVTGGRRSLYKRLLTLNRVYEDQRTQTAYDRVYHLDQRGTAELEALLRGRLAGVIDRELRPDELIVDTPPRDKDTIETVEVVFDRASGSAFPLEAISKVVQGIATDFVKVVKKIRVFVHPQVREAIRSAGREREVRELLIDSILAFEPEPHPQQKLL